ncbi:MAG: DUF3999 family protein, partial [Gammaproteobacteria bacterium]|nr:DUF3999 family protein [Gammaproteobacteria bacterium]
MTLKQLVSTVLVFLLVFSARGQEAYMPEDFAYGAPLSESENAIRKFYLTAEILKDLANRDAGDLRVYDSQDNVMPAIVRLAGAAAVAEKRSLEFFPLYEMTNTGSAMETLQIMRDSGNQIQRIVSTQNSPEPGKRIAAYLIDQGVDVPSDRAMRLTRLHLDWEGSLHANLIQLKLEHSDNLNTWQLLPGQFTLSD